ncbi:hypothetical protein [Natrinema marinum]|uniref:hypothetical protein n=1 Tax=Natrinema marinum TaxID=2961598 RepID=UPI0020C88660|nr:hypothetical protein [Natrinema marinum]
MTGRGSTERPAIGDRIAESPEATFPFAFAGYVGTLVATLAAFAVVRVDISPTVAGAVVVVGFLVGTLVGVAIAGRDQRLPVRLGRSWRRRTAVLSPAAPLGLIAGAAWLGRLEPDVGLVGLGAMFLVAIIGLVTMRLAETCYVASITADEPRAHWRWEPPSTRRLDTFVLAVWLLLGATNAYGGEWASAIVWTGLALGWMCTGLAEGRWRIASFGEPPEIRVHDAGLVTQRPYTRAIVPWSDVSRVRLREDELVLDRGFFDVRFERDQLADLEAARAVIEQHLDASRAGPGTAPR